MKTRKNNTNMHLVASASKILLVALVALSVFIAQCGIEFNKHTCSSSGHQHIDIDLLAGADALMICLDDKDDCCCDHNESEEEHSNNCCTDDIIIVHADYDSFAQHYTVHLDKPLCHTILFAYSIFNQSISNFSDYPSYNKYPIHTKIGQSHSRRCALLCTLLC
ncbi:MAG: hypothetical protein Q4C30_07410 [Bacteroidia bacterium]|nr:hypothetical protein [Bacteroidia bacterium]